MSMSTIFGGQLSSAPDAGGFAKYLRPTSTTHITPSGSISIDCTYWILLQSFGSCASMLGHGLSNGLPPSTSTTTFKVEGTPGAHRGTVPKIVCPVHFAATFGVQSFRPVKTLFSGM